MFVAALEILSWSTQQERTRGHQRAASTGLILKTACPDDRDADSGMLLFSRADIRSSIAEHIGYTPAIPVSE